MGVNTKSFDNASDMITFSRASGGYGLTKVSYGPELVTNGTFDTDSDWTKQTSWTIGGGVASYDAVTTAERLTQLISLTTGKIVKISYTVKNVAAGKTAYFNVKGSSGSSPVYKNYTNHTEGDYEIITTVEEGTVGLVFTALNSGTGGTFDLDNISIKEVTYNSSAANATLQLIYHPNDVPRIEYNTDGTAKGLLVEEIRTNLITYSEFTGGWAGKTQITLSPNSVTSPTGNQDGALVTSSGIDPYAFNFTSVSAGNDYTFTVWLKGVGNTVGRAPKVWMLNNSATMTSVVADTTPLSSEWQRYTATATCTVSGTTLARIDFDNSDLSVLGEQVQVFGAQFEAGAFPTSYIKTEGATATRSADIASIPVADFGYNQSEGTLFAEASSYEGSPMLLHLNSGSDSNRAQISASASNVSGYVQATGDSGSFISVAGAPTVPFEVALGIETDNIGLTVGGSSVSTDTSQNMPVSITKLNIGSGAIGGSVGQAHIKSIKYYPRRLSNAQLQELTT